MTRNTAFWLLVCMFVIPAGLVGLLQGIAAIKAYRAVCKDLRDSGLVLSEAEYRSLFRQLNRRPQSEFAVHDSAEAQEIIQQHAQPLVERIKFLRLLLWLITILGAVAVVLFWDI